MYDFLFELDDNGDVFSDFIEIHSTIIFSNKFNNTNYTVSYSKNHSLNKKIVMNPKKTIPIGTLDFVNNFINLFLDSEFKPKPINIPLVLLEEEFTKRDVGYFTRKDLEAITLNPNTFVKSADKYKSTLDFFDNSSDVLSESDSEEFLVSDYVDFISEYRIFVHNDFIVGMKHYSGDFFLYPNDIKIRNMVDKYSKDSKRPKSYTLDVGILDNNETVIIEVHPMVSVGLYGFSNSNYLLPMIIQGFISYSNLKL